MTTEDATEYPSRPRRWYDHDPVLTELMDLLHAFQADVEPHAQAFLVEVQRELNPYVIEQAETTRFREGKRWYDQNPTLAVTVEVLRQLPPQQQRALALNFIERLRQQPALATVIQQRD